MFTKFRLLLGLLPNLGYKNMAYIIWYRFTLRTKLRKCYFKIEPVIEGVFFKKCPPVSSYPEEWKSALRNNVDNIIEGNLVWFSKHEFHVGNPTDWFLNPFNNERINNPYRHWTDLGDFDTGVGDIKTIWEPSRFNWLTDLARGYRVFGEEKYLNNLNKMLQDWVKNNPTNQGPNWKCGQEAGIRIMKLLTTSYILKQFETSTIAFQTLIFQHIVRIFKNIQYANAQDNNHIISEASALFVGAAWLRRNGNKPNQILLKKYEKFGRRLLEKKIKYLIGENGTFSQRSVTYHRVVCDTMSWVLWSMELLNLESFSQFTLHRLKKLLEWLYKMTIHPVGDTPNVGSNDGALFENLHECDYRDFRPSTQLLSYSLLKRGLYPFSSFNEPVYWRFGKIKIDHDSTWINSPKIEILDGQFLIMKLGSISVFVKIPSKKFRPSGNDIFHVDVWRGGINVLRDNGSYSYNSDLSSWFKSVKAHNTVQFGHCEPMPKISRFLYGKWIEPEYSRVLNSGDEVVEWEGGYFDYKHNKLVRNIKLHKTKIIIEDKMEGSCPKTINFHLMAGNWTVKENSISLDRIKIEFLHPAKFELTKSWNSRYYMQKEELPFLKVSTDSKKMLTIIDLE